MAGIRQLWTEYKRGYSQAAILLNASTLMVTVYTAVAITFPEAPRLWIIGGILALVPTAFFILARLGRWDYLGKRTLWKKDVEVEVKNHPYLQALIKTIAAMAKEQGVDASDLEEWLK